MPQLNDVTTPCPAGDRRDSLGERLRSAFQTRDRRAGDLHDDDTEGATALPEGGTPAAPREGTARPGETSRPDRAEGPEAAVGFVRLIREDTRGGPRLVTYLVPENGPEEEGRFDTVVLDAIVQDLSSAESLVAAIAHGLRHLAPGGSLVITDVRSLPLLEPMHASVELARAEAEVTPQQLTERIRRCVAAEQDLAVDPRFFDALRDHFPEVEQVRVAPRPGPDSALTRFRYDVVLRVADRPSVADAVPVVRADVTGGGGDPSRRQDRAERQDRADWQDWDAAGFSRAELVAEFCEREADVITARDVPNARVGRFAEALRLLGSEPTTTIEALRALTAAPAEDELDPQDLWDLGRVHGYHVEIDFSRHEVDGRFDLVAWRDDVPPPVVRRRPDDPDVAAARVLPRDLEDYTNSGRRPGPSI